MKKTNKVVMFLKVGFIAFSLAILFGGISTTQRIGATAAGCSSTPCQAGYIYGCYGCINGDCNGCYRANNESGCGVCSGGGTGIEEVSTSWFVF